MSYRIERVGIEAAPLVLEHVLALLVELGDEAEDLGTLDTERVLAGWRARPDACVALFARDATGAVAGLLTLSEAFAIYANGTYGVIDEMYVRPPHRSRGVGRMLIEAAVALGRDKGWQRLDVTAPESERWDRTRRFYEREGFAFTGPKLKRVLR